MAKFWNHFKYHYDTVEKHKITEEEIAFLKGLQKEMNTQDHAGQADPRYWVIKGSEKEYGIETGFEDGADLVDDDCCETVATDMESAMVYIRDNLLDEINDTDGIHRSIELISGILHPCIKISWKEEYFDDYQEFENMEELAEWLGEHGYDYRVANYKITEKVYPNTMFLTQKAAEEHLRYNSHHYSEDAHTYAMTAWRSKEADMLCKILHEVDFDKLN